MLSKRVLDALCEQFDDEFGELSERDGCMQQMKADAFALIGSMAPNDRRLETDVDDVINGIVAAASALGFYIGMRTGADMVACTTDNKFPEQFVAAYGDLEERA